MDVEVNEANIVKYGLVQLTGNSVEVLLTRAREARSTNTVLCVHLPDDIVRQNIFDTADGETPTEEELRAQDNVANPILADDGRTVRLPNASQVEINVVQVDGPTDGDDIVDAEIVED